MSGLLPHAKVLQSRRELEMTNEKENVCLALFFSENSLPIGLRPFDLPIMHRDFKGTAGSRDALKRLAL